MDRDRAALLATIAASPADDLPRLVYADWLEDRGAAADVARAKFIRLQIDISRAGFLEWPSPLERAYLRVHGRAWYPGWRPEWHDAVAYDRGFPYTLSLGDTPRRDLPGVAAALADADPELGLLSALQVSDSATVESALGAALAASPALTRVRHLMAIQAAPNLTGLWANPGLTNLSDLDVSFVSDGTAGPWMAAAPTRPGVRRLCFTRHGPGAFDGDELLSGGTFPSVRDLDLSVGRLDPAVTARSRLARPARRLSLSLADPGGGEVLDVLAAGAGPPDLTELSLHASGWDYDALVRFASSLRPGRLRLLSFEGCDEWSAGGVPAVDAFFAALAASPVLAGLEHLDVSDHVGSPAAAAALIDAAAAAGVRRLGVGIPRNEPRFLDHLLTTPALDHFDLFALPLRDDVSRVRTRLGRRAAAGLTWFWCAGQRRWNPL